MCGAGKAIDATMFATPIGVDRPVERDIGGFVAGDDAAALIEGYRGVQPGLRIVFGICPPAIVNRRGV